MNKNVIKECRVWLDAASPPFYFPLFHTHTNTHTFGLILWRLPALRDCLPAYQQRCTRRMTDDHLRHLSGSIVRAPYRSRPSPRPADRPHFALIVAASSPFWAGRRGLAPGAELSIASAHASLLSSPLEVGTLSFWFLEESETDGFSQ